MPSYLTVQLAKLSELLVGREKDGGLQRDGASFVPRATVATLGAVARWAQCSKQSLRRQGIWAGDICWPTPVIMNDGRHGLKNLVIAFREDQAKRFREGYT